MEKNKIIIASQLPFKSGEDFYTIILGYIMDEDKIDDDSVLPELAYRIYKYDELKKDGRLLEESEIPESIIETAEIYLKGFIDGTKYTTSILSATTEKSLLN